MPVYNAPIASLSTLTPQQQENLILMADTDVRSILQSLKAVTTLQAAQAATIAMSEAGLLGLRAITVVEKVKQLDRAGFIFAAGFWSINVFHELNNKFPITAIFDAQGDTQFIQFIGRDLMNGTVELTQAQYDSNSFPLTVVLHSKSTIGEATTTASGFKRHPGSAAYYKFLDGGFYSSSDGITGVLLYSVGLSYEFYMPTNTPNLFVFGDGIAYREPIGTTGGPWVEITQTDFDTAKLAIGTVRL